MKDIPKIIAVAGNMHVGKDEVMNLLSTFIPEYKVVRFADPIKAYLSTLSGDPLDMFNKYKFKQKHNNTLGMSPRNSMTLLGEWTRETFGPNIFAESLFSQHKDHIIIADLRLKEEADAIIERGGFIIKVERHFDLRFPGLKDFTHFKNRYNFNDIRLFQEHPDFYYQLTRESELQVTHIKGNVTIENNGSLEDLKEKVRTLWF